LQCNAARLYVPPPLLSSLNHRPAAHGATSPALALSTTQRRRLLSLSGLTLSLLQLLMRSPDRRGVHRHELHRALKRVSGTATAAEVFAIITKCVFIVAEPYRFGHAIFVRPSDTIGALKDKMMRIGGVSGLSRDDLRFHNFGGLELQNDSIAPDHNIEVTLVPSGDLHIYVDTNIGRITCRTSSSESIELLKLKIWLATGVPPSEMRLQFGNSSRCYSLVTTVADYNIKDGDTIDMIWRHT
jgi:hypothetical protein